MKQQSVSTGMVVAAIAVLVIIIAVVGWKVIGSGNGSTGAAPPEAQKWIKNPAAGMSGNYHPANSAPPGAMGGSGGGPGSGGPGSGGPGGGSGGH